MRGEADGCCCRLQFNDGCRVPGSGQGTPRGRARSYLWGSAGPPQSRAAELLPPPPSRRGSWPARLAAPAGDTTRWRGSARPCAPPPSPAARPAPLTRSRLTVSLYSLLSNASFSRSCKTQRTELGPQPRPRLRPVSPDTARPDLLFLGPAQHRAARRLRHGCRLPCPWQPRRHWPRSQRKRRLAAGSDVPEVQSGFAEVLRPWS